MEPTQEDLPRILHEAMLSDPSSALERDMLRKLAYAYLDRPRVWQQCKAVLKQHKLVRDVEGRVKVMAREMADIPSIGGPPAVERSISDVWPNAPVGDDVFVPDGYSVNDNVPAIERVEQRMMGDSPYEKRHSVCLDPLVITRRIGHVQHKGLLLQIAFRTSAGWRTCVGDRDVFFNARKIIDTAHMGMPVASDNALELVAWLRHYENANRDRIPIGFATGSMGWQGEDDHPTHHGFLCGTRQIGANGRAIELEGSDGDMMDAREIKGHGNFDAWCNTIEELAQFPAIRIGVCAALASPLIAILEAPNPIYEWAGRTSTGKSTILKVAQSVWRSGQSQMATWNTTPIGIEAAAQFNCDLPLIIDDTSAAVEGGRNQSIGKIIYQLVSGRARGRANVHGTQRIRSRWRTVVLATGETPLGELAKAEGASARVLTFWSAPLGETTPQTGELITRCLHKLGENYGHAGPRVVSWLCDNRESWDAIRRLYQETTSRVRNTICTPAASRLADIVALLECAAWVGKASGVLPWLRGSLYDQPDVVEALRGAMTLATSSSDRAYDAWEYAVSEALSRPKSWIAWGEEPGKDERDPPGGWLGYYNKDEWSFFPQQLRKVLTQGGFTPEAAFRAWKDLGVLIQPEKDRFTSQARPGHLHRMKIRLIRVRNEYPGHELDDD